MPLAVNLFLWMLGIATAIIVWRLIVQKTADADDNGSLEPETAEARELRALRSELAAARKEEKVRRRRSGAGIISGVVGCIFALLGIFTFGIVFVPIAALVTLDSIWRSVTRLNPAGMVMAFVASILTIWGFVTSPALMLAVAGIIGASIKHQQFGETADGSGGWQSAATSYQLPQCTDYKTKDQIKTAFDGGPLAKNLNLKLFEVGDVSASTSNGGDDTIVCNATLYTSGGKLPMIVKISWIDKGKGLWWLELHEVANSSANQTFPALASPLATNPAIPQFQNPAPPTSPSSAAPCFSDGAQVTLRGTASNTPYQIADGTMRTAWVLATDKPLCTTDAEAGPAATALVSYVQIIGSPPPADALIELTGVLRLGNFAQSSAVQTGLVVTAGRLVK